MDTVTGPTCPTPFCVEYTIDPEATWPDGTPVTAEDFVRTHRLALAEGAAGYETIAGFETTDPKHVVVEFRVPYGGWSGLFSRLIGPGAAQGGGGYRARRLGARRQHRGFPCSRWLVS